ncbi:vimentin, isoform CRA_d [Rattus norvegicus]|uniref:Vimentin, isoform CRA_d n=1 Tax=Rattus norvegicus TaxID=10116 RepID=A6JM46_RAT|nr:vimentin, isoform CRA_d [Rattus norvegicus]
MKEALGAVYSNRQGIVGFCVSSTLNSYKSKVIVLWVK